MFKKLLKIGTIYESYMVKRGRIEAHRILMSKDDQTLADIGISRHELQGGIKNWPWDGSGIHQKIESQEISSQKAVELKAVRELSNYSDRQLHDLGINRGMIIDAVRNGRPGIDDPLPPTRPSKMVDSKQAA